jgi:hypothetical protein
LVIGEEIGPDSNIRWVECNIAPANADALGAVPFNLLIPKTTMPVKTYALPDVHVRTTGITDLSWGVSFVPIIQELMKVIDTLSTLSVDPSPPLGFWDKLAMILHWRVNIKFDGEVHVHLKGISSTCLLFHYLTPLQAPETYGRLLVLLLASPSALSVTLVLLSGTQTLRMSLFNSSVTTC